MLTSNERAGIAVGIMAVSFLSIVAILSTGSRPKSAAASPAERAQQNARFDSCREKLEKARKIDLLYDLTLDPRPRVLVGPTFFEIPLDAKQGFADTVNCFVMAGKDEHVNFPLLDYRTGRVVAEYSFGTLSVN
ncbi:MAG TPA: hypothetical protein VKT80_02905 [Chloroflexota bacterium]|nr:hypothetical protein [Chloroflexota bacterium]